MNTGNNYETERDVLLRAEDAEAKRTNVEEASNVQFGVELKDYLRQLQTEFILLRDRGEIGEDQLRVIDADLRKIEDQEINFDNKQEASQSLLLVFKNMEAWQKQMRDLVEVDPGQVPDAERHYHGSKQIFMESCNDLYPGKDASLTLIGAEILTIKREMGALTDPQMLEQIERLNGQLGGFDSFANQMEKKSEENPHQAVHDLEQIMLALTNGVEESLQSPQLNETQQKQLDIVVEIIYKVQILIDKIKASKVYREQTISGQELASVGKSEKKEEEREQKLILADEVWNKYLKDAFKTMDAPDGMTIEEYLNSETRATFDAMNLDAQQNEYISEILPGIWEEYDNKTDGVSQKQVDKIDNFKLRIGEMLHKASQM